ncbi:MAG: ACT domain-containing protein [Clostridia bacterium]|nr:ACT domain-containing protein [Clostridia bacterium]
MRAIVSVIGKDRTGIIAKVATALYELSVNIEDISQTVMQNEYFTMIMMVGLSDEANIKDIDASLQKVASELGVEIRIQHEDIFNLMHRV